MPITLFESGGDEDQKKGVSTSVVIGKVVNNCDLFHKQQVLVRIPSLDIEVAARLTAPGGGPGTGFYHLYRVGDEVLVTLNDNDPANTCIIAGLYNPLDPPPVDNLADALTKRKIRSGLVAGVGNEIEMDDALQSISIVSTTKQKITIDPNKIELSNTAGTLTITLDNESQTITVRGAHVKVIGLASLAMDAPKIDLTSKGPITIASDTVCTVKGRAAVKIN
jgi:uncharacterized protein involved in type VI secretion and phage assembly